MQPTFRIKNLDVRDAVLNALRMLYDFLEFLHTNSGVIDNDGNLMRLNPTLNTVIKLRSAHGQIAHRVQQNARARYANAGIIVWCKKVN